MATTPKKTDTRENVKTVTDNAFITAKGIEGISLKGRKLLYLAISQCRKDDTKFYTFSISAKDFANLVGVTADDVYNTADKISCELMKGYIEVGSGRNWEKYSLFSKCSYKQGVLTFKLNPDMTSFLLQLKGDFTQPLLQDFMHMRGTYTMAVWHLMQREMKSRKPGIGEMILFDLSFEELREVTGTQKKLKQVCNFKERVLDKAIKDIADNCGVIITYDNITEGRRVIGFHFCARSQFQLSDYSKAKALKKTKVIS